MPNAPLVQQAHDAQPAEPSSTPAKPGTMSRPTAIVAFIMVAISLFLLWRLSSYASVLEIIATATPKEPATAADGHPHRKHEWKVTGHVYHGARPVAGISLFVVAGDGSEYGYGYSSKEITTTDAGTFEIDEIPFQLEVQSGEPKPIRVIRVYARKPGSFWSTEQKNDKLLIVEPDSRPTHIEFSGSWKLLIPASIFLFTIAVVTFSSTLYSWLYLRYYGSLLLALVLSVSMVAVIAMTILQFDDTAQREASLGFLKFYKGTYVEGQPQEWLISLTSAAANQADRPIHNENKQKGIEGAKKDEPKEGKKEPLKKEEAKDDAKKKDLKIDDGKKTEDPPEAAKSTPIVRGVGAPFWVIFVSVLGSSLATILLVIRSVINPPAMSRPGARPIADPAGGAETASRSEAVEPKEKENNKEASNAKPDEPKAEDQAKENDETKSQVDKQQTEKPAADQQDTKARQAAGMSETDDADNRKRIQQTFREVLENQFYILLAPFSGIFLYQLLVLGRAASEPVMVAWVILGAGATLNGLLARGVHMAESWARGDRQDGSATK